MLPAAPPTAEQLRSWGLDPSWSRLVTFAGADGKPVTWHVLDTGPPVDSSGTLVCVHGNPSWGYLWRDVLTTLAPSWRVVAVDQTGMGWSERPGGRRLAQRVEELVTFCRQETPGPVVLVAHDWGGAIAVGASAQLEVAALVLANTAVAKPDGVAVPPLIAAARRFVDLSCRRTSAFVDGAAAMTARTHRSALRAPYRSTSRRAAIADFVADIPVLPSDPSAPALAAVGAAFEALDCPVLLIWGGRDAVFHDRFLADLRRRKPSADVHRFAGASHFVPLDEPVGDIIATWLDKQGAPAQVSAHGGDAPVDLLAEVVRRARDDEVLYRGPDGTLTWRQLHEHSLRAAHHLLAAGCRPGDRVALVVPPGAELLVAAVAVWRARGVLVVADASAGVRTLRRLLRAAAPRLVVGTPTTVVAARAAGMTPAATALCFGALPGAIDLGAPYTATTILPAPPGADDLAAVVHTSGATGPAKPVRYTFGALEAQRTVVATMLGLCEGEAFTTSFAPFLLLAPVLGAPCVLPAFPVDEPELLGFDPLEAATASVPVGAAWLSPAAARALVATAGGRTLSLRTTLLAGAPISPALAAAVARVTGDDVRAPYGMTECLPVTDGVGIEVVGPHGGTATGRPLPGCTVIVEPLAHPGDSPAAFGQLLVSAPWMYDGYDGRWWTDLETTVWIDGQQFHRTGDVGYLHEGVLFQLGRLAHVIATPEGPVASIAVEGPVAEALGRAVAAVGVGPPGAQRIALVVEDADGLAVAELAQSSWARAVAPVPLAAVLTGPLPTDIRHHSKVDRTRLAAQVTAFLDGR